jgi:hypothetical protein
MKLATYKKLKPRDAVTLAAPLSTYSCGHPTPDGRVYVPAGTVGIVGSVNVPEVYTRLNKAPRPYGFTCVDFPAGTPLVDLKGNTTRGWFKENAKVRVAAWPEDLA